MKTIFSILILSGTSLQLLAQGTLQNTSGSTIKTSNNAYIVLNNMSVVNNGSFVQAIGDGTVRLTGNTNTTTSGTGTTTLDKLEVAITNGSSHTLSSAVNLVDILTVTTGQLAANGYLTLKSTSITNTALVAPIDTGATVTGNVVVERFIPKYANNGAGYRAFRDVSPGVLTTDNIFTSWQQNGSNNTGFGTQITGKRGTVGQIDAVTGLEYTSTGNNSLYGYNINMLTGAATWDAITNTKTTIVSPFKGYRILIRGDRTNNLGADVPYMTSTATLQSKGQLVTGTITYSIAGAMANGTLYNNAMLAHDTVNAFTMIGNPYVSPIDWISIMGNSYNTSIRSACYIWDPNVGTSGAYVTYNTAGGGISSNPSGSRVNQFIQPGQAFFIQNNNTLVPQFQIREADKATLQDASHLTNVFGEGIGTPISKIYFSILKNVSGKMVNMDGATMCYRNDFNDTIANEDAEKIDNNSECIAINSHASLYSIEGKSKTVSTDSIVLKLYYTTNNTNYQLQVNLSNFLSNGLQPFLKDKFTKTTTLLTLGEINTYPFVATADTNSSNNRFAIVFTQNTVLPIAFTSIKAYNNIGTNSNTVEWSANETNADYYEVEYANNATQNFTTIGKILATGLSNYNYLHNTTNGGNNFYRIKGVDKSGLVKYSTTVMVANNNAKPVGINIYPNPVINGNVNIGFSNMAAGNYKVAIYSVDGKTIYNGSLSHNGFQANYTISLTNNIQSGIYEIKISNGNSTHTQKLMIK